MPNNFFITGCAGFIGSNLVDRLLNNGVRVVGYDNFSTGHKEFLHNALKNPNFKLIKGDILNLKQLTKAMNSCEFVFHLAANADVRYGLEHPQKDLLVNTVGTSNVLEAMRKNNIKNIVFASTGSVYGKNGICPFSENMNFPIQTSLYGASKLAGEGLIQAYCEGYNFQAWIFRFVSILGERYHKGFAYDFYNNLKKDSSKLEVLGNGTAKKSYLYVHDCIDAMFLAIEKSHDKINIFNLGTDEFMSVKECAKNVIKYLNLNAIIKYGKAKTGWVGDNPFIWLDINKIKSLGWKPKLTIKEAIKKTLEYLKNNSLEQ